MTKTEPQMSDVSRLAEEVIAEHQGKLRRLGKSVRGLMLTPEQSKRLAMLSGADRESQVKRIAEYLRGKTYAPKDCYRARIRKR